jgi:hypothetical protein
MSSLISVLAATLLLAPQHPTMPKGMSHEEHLKADGEGRGAEEARRGGDGVRPGRDDASLHAGALWWLNRSHGQEQKDEAAIAAVRSHLRSIAADFARGEFDKPFYTHGEVPPGVPEMQKSKLKITYRYEDLAQGAVVRIGTKDARALDAIHAFLRYQVTEHQTGDPKLNER